ncbi:glycoside hydrolase, partial [Rhodotorula sp. JG-1b]
FYGLAYTPFNALEPWCGASLNNVTEDILLMSQMTTRLRMYGSACNQTQLVLQAIQDTKVNMTVWLGAYVGDNSTVNAEQQQWVLDALQIYGTDHVSGVTIGNECALFLRTSGRASRPRRRKLTFSVFGYIQFRTQLAALNLPKTLPVGTADAGSAFTNANTLAAGSDFIMANVHPWFGGVPIEQAAGWTWEFFEENDVAISEAVSNKPVPYVAETGWPTASMTPENATLGGAVAGVSELQTFLDTYPCQANANESYYFFFEPFDEPWKVQFGGVEPYWGLFNSDRTLKDITFPTC